SMTTYPEPTPRKEKKKKVFQNMSNGGFVFIQEEGTGSHKPVTKSLIKMHVMDRVVMQRRALKQEHRDDDILIVNVPHSDQAPSLEHHISHNDLRSLAGIDNMLRLSGLSVELMYGDLDEAEIHFQGLKTLIRGCKGVLHLGFEGLVARILSNQELSFDETSSSSEFVHPQIPLPDAQRFHIQPHKLAITHELRLIARELITNPKDNMAPDSRVALGFRLLASDRSILKHVHGVNDCSVLALVARAALLYSHTVLRGASRSSRIISISIDQLKQLIVSALVSKGDIFASHPIALVWVLLVGVVASGRENIQGTWFRLCLEKACGSDSKLSWEKVQATINAPNNISPQPFYWMIEEIPLHLQCINSAILC
ncbi:hypothetical protein N5P37_010252, partial [Trichoderma harzianum]